LGDLAAYHRRRFDLPVVAVTGSNGKTTCKEMIGAILAEGASVLKGEGNFNNFIGLPLQVLALEPRHERAVFEMGMNRSGEISRLAQITAPSIGVITGVAPAHLEGLGSIEAVREAKGELLEVMGASGVAVLPGEDLQCQALAERHLNAGGRVVSFGLEARRDVYATRVQMSPAGETSFFIHLGGAEAEVSLPGVGRHNVLNALAAAAACAELGSSLEEIVRGLENSSRPSMRLGVESFHGGAHLLNDAYNANPTSVRLAIETVCELKGAGRAFAILGDMKELGAYEEFAHMEIGRKAVSGGLDFLAGVGPMMRLAVGEAHKAGMPLEQAEVFTTPEEAAAWANEWVLPGDWVLVKGSRSMEMERAAEALRD
ncbi:MAG: UDP-N-acetylmuramoyl-tripeptide--D-alanyl-D-alanine ligase, partial [Nitrospinaceae bacterium]|nr:UDP-N-acetylmuramoyl-tripeptide--D-alanyl-D-alanine ligase [Nitrospinaceae bacterium]